MSDDRPRIGISACLLGQPVRFDTGHKRDPFLVETFGEHVEWVPVCPEVEAGFGTPREEAFRASAVLYREQRDAMLEILRAAEAAAQPVRDRKWS